MCGEFQILGDHCGCGFAITTGRVPVLTLTRTLPLRTGQCVLASPTKPYKINNQGGKV